MLLVDTTDLERRIEEIPWVERASVRTDFPHRLVCVGERTGVEFKVRQRAEQLGIGERILLVGHVAQEALPAVYQGAELFLFPTLYEGFGLPAGIGTAMGRPAEQPPLAGAPPPAAEPLAQPAPAAGSPPGL